MFCSQAWSFHCNEVPSSQPVAYFSAVCIHTFLMVYIPLVCLFTLLFKLSQNWPFPILSSWLWCVKPLSYWGSVSDIRRYLSHGHLTSLPMPGSASLWPVVGITEIWILSSLIAPGVTLLFSPSSVRARTYMHHYFYFFLIFCFGLVFEAEFLWLAA